MGTHVAGGAAAFLRLQPTVTLPTSESFTPDANGAGASDFTRMIMELDKLLCEALPAAPAKTITRRAASSAAATAAHTHDVFISHAFDANYDSDASADRVDGTPSCDEGSTAATDHALAGRVHAALKARGWRVALSAHAELIDPEPSHRHLYQTPIRRAIHNSAAVVVVLTEAYLQTCADELDAVISNTTPTRSRPYPPPTGARARPSRPSYGPLERNGVRPHDLRDRVSRRRNQARPQRAVRRILLTRDVTQA